MLLDAYRRVPCTHPVNVCPYTQTTGKCSPAHRYHLSEPTGRGSYRNAKILMPAKTSDFGRSTTFFSPICPQTVIFDEKTENSVIRRSKTNQNRIKCGLKQVFNILTDFSDILACFRHFLSINKMTLFFTNLSHCQFHRNFPDDTSTYRTKNMPFQRTQNFDKKPGKIEEISDTTEKLFELRRKFRPASMPRSDGRKSPKMKNFSG